MVKIPSRPNHIWKKKDLKKSSKGTRYGCCLVHETLKICNFSAKKAILMRFSTIMYLHKISYLAEKLA